MRKRIFAAFVCLCMLMALVPSMAYADDTVYTGELCEHHTQHDGACGYTEGTAEIPCSHEHTESCGGLTDPTACHHTHDEACGYVPATEGSPCTFVCEVCNAQDSGDEATPSDAQPEECTCETLCTEEEVNGDCPVCSAEGAELDKVCVGAAPILLKTTFAAGNGKAIQLGTSALNENANTDNAATIYFGKNGADQPTSWLVIGYDGSGVVSTQGDMTLLAASTMGVVKFDSDGPSNEYVTSDLKIAIEALAEKLTAEENAAVNERTLTSGSFNGENTDCVAGAQVDDAAF